MIDLFDQVWQIDRYIEYVVLIDTSIWFSVTDTSIRLNVTDTSIRSSVIDTSRHISSRLFPGNGYF